MAIEVRSNDRVDIVDVTSDVADIVAGEMQRGICTVYVPHTTAGVIVNEREERLCSDIKNALERLVPRDEGYGHDSIDDNADAHLRATLLGESVTIPVRSGELALGTWQSILFVDCDGPRTRRLQVTVVEGCVGE
ncbi:secondary thiamine-phosphate synthase enzyme YjbQ [Natrinema halophilum]|uniref:secondary thiamine-phosphate synthase enzyme YjbQ n=1 Tax=Natrinema halophilum TaxID=1699371 RepID=UPI001F013651|nr:secondary thiamine-phosphate synthase enzyme YjbQ [Natrinema halophilum]UHQ96085.1 secondary thiamine-phosphate synthase enzyme YjbQ [Natrinema halophilum]